jgi:glycosyltransferase involved in cell wall biosynthesis
MRILGIHTNTGSRIYRITPELKWMQQQGHEVRLERHNDPYLDQYIEWADAIVFQLIFDVERAKKARAAGKAVFFECDDLMHKTHEKHYAFEETRRFSDRLKWWWRVFRMLRAADGFICTTEELRRTYGWMARKTLVFGNYLDLPFWLKPKKTNPSDRIRLLWAGSTSHTGDLEWVRPIIAAILEKYPQVQFMYIGHGGVPTDDLYARFIYGEDIFEGLPRDRRESMLAAPPTVWPYVLGGLEADIAIAPLERNYFNRFKSQCKYGIPGVYAKWFYTDVRDWRHTGQPELSTGLLADSPQEWIDALSLLIEDATLRHKIGDNARREAIEKYDFRLHAKRWQGFVESTAWRSPPSPSSLSGTEPVAAPA